MKKVIKASTIQAEEAVYEPIDEGYENWEKEMRNNPEFQKLAKLCHLHGYQLHEAHNEKYPSGTLKRTIRMTPNPNRGPWAQYLSDIYYRQDRRNTTESFYAQTTSVGTLSPEQYNFYAMAVSHTQQLLEALSVAHDWEFAALYTWEMEE